jgi:hypothetical protein
MFPDPAALANIPVYDLLQAGARGHVGIDQRFIRAILDRGEQAVPDLLRFGLEERQDDRVDLEEDLIAVFRHLHSEQALPFYIACVRRQPDEVPDDLVEGILPFGEKAVDPLLEICGTLEEDQTADSAFLLANLGVRDSRILEILLDRLDFDAGDGAFCLGLYGDPAAKPALEKMLAEIPAEDNELRREFTFAIEQIDAGKSARVSQDPEPFDIWEIYPDEAPPPFEVLSTAEVLEMLESESAGNRISAAESFRNRELDALSAESLFEHAKTDRDAKVRAACWEALADADDDKIRAAMKRVVRDSSRDIVERSGALVGLCNASDDPQVAAQMREFYESSATRAKALEAMWRSFDKQFSGYFPKHLDDADMDIKRQAIWGTGYMGLGGEATRLEKMFDDQELRQDALFAYAMCVPGEISRGRVRRMLRKIDDAAGALSPGETELVKIALDQRLIMHRLEPVFSEEHEDEDHEHHHDHDHDHNHDHTLAEDPPVPAAQPVKAAAPGRNDPCPCGSGKKYKKCHGA